MINSILGQVKLAEKRANHMEWDAQEKKGLSDGTVLENNNFQLQENL